MAKLLYQGHGSYHITGDNGAVLYLDTFAGTGYDLPADVILVTPQHGAHNQIQLVTQKPGCTVITQQQALAGGTYHRFHVAGMGIEAVEAYNKNHPSNQCVGYIITVDSVTIYGAGDTSTTRQMSQLAKRHLDYALLPGDGIYNMDLAEASECAALIGAAHNIPIHLKPGALFDRSRAEMFTGPNRLIVEPGQEIVLEKAVF